MDRNAYFACVAYFQTKNKMLNLNISSTFIICNDFCKKITELYKKMKLKKEVTKNRRLTRFFFYIFHFQIIQLSNLEIKKKK